MAINNTGIPMNVVKEPQCRHAPEFLSYAITLGLHSSESVVTCSNCGTQARATWVQPLATVDARYLQEASRTALMSIEAPPLVP